MKEMNELEQAALFDELETKTSEGLVDLVVMLSDQVDREYDSIRELTKRLVLAADEKDEIALEGITEYLLEKSENISQAERVMRFAQQVLVDRGDDIMLVMGVALR